MYKVVIPLIYDKRHFRKDKARSQYKFYSDRRIMVERGVDVTDLDAPAPRIRVVLDAQG